MFAIRHARRQTGRFPAGTEDGAARRQNLFGDAEQREDHAAQELAERRGGDVHVRFAATADAGDGDGSESMVGELHVRRVWESDGEGGVELGGECVDEPDQRTEL
jgi:hypothetical protein